MTHPVQELAQRPAKARRGDAALERALDLYIAIAASPRGVALSTHAERLRIPLSTARRMVAALVRKGLVARVGQGEFRTPAPLQAGLRDCLAAAAALPVRRLARKLRKTVHLGIFDTGMVTYLLKEDGGATPLFTRPDNQQEAYCSALGKLLLANLPAAQQEEYLREGPFIALTENTITSPDALRAAFRTIAAQGFATDDAEIAERLRCIAVPVHGPGGEIVAALSCSQITEKLAPAEARRVRDALSATATTISAQLGPLLFPARHS